MKEYAVPEQLVNAILQYLGGRPYIEVAPLIGQLAQIQEVPKVAPVPPISLVPKPKGE